MKIVTIVSYPRTGSSLLIHQARSLPLGALLEIFHPSEAVAKDHLANSSYGDSFSHLANSYIREDVVSKLPVFLAELVRACPHEVVAYKVFPGHLPSTALEEAISESSAVLIHTRNRLHSFISDVIASQLGKWGGVNTTSKSIAFNEGDFRKYIGNIQDFLSLSVNYAIDHRKTILFSSFEGLITSKSPKEQLSRVSRLFSHVTGHELEPLHGPRDLPKKQDQRSYASDKVDNGADLLSFLDSNGAKELDRNDVDIAFSRYYELINR